MAARLNRAWQNFRARVNPAAEDVDSIDEDEITSPEANNRRLRLAIDYLAKEGGADSLAQYRDRVNKINKFIIEQYPGEGYSFDPLLYRRLRSMVNDQLKDFEHAPKVNVGDSDSDVVEVDRADALYRYGDDDDDDDYEVSTESSTSSSEISTRPSATVPQHYPTSSSDLKDAMILETIFRYGGPKNDAEEYHRGFPATLPFGETFYMQEWESLKINYDLRESAKRRAANQDSAIIHNDVPYSLAVQNVDKGKGGGSGDADYDSGSRFKLPYDAATQRSVDADQTLNLKDSINLFNKGDDRQIKKDYAPRIFLETLSATEQQAPASASRSSQSSRTPSRSSISSKPSTPITQPSASTSPVARRGSISAKPLSRVRSPSIPKPTTAKPRTRRVSHVSPAPTDRTRPDRPKWTPSTPTPLTTRTRAKRKIATADDSYDEGMGKRTKKVAFKQGEELEDVETVRLKATAKPAAKRATKTGAKPKTGAKAKTSAKPKPKTKTKTTVKSKPAAKPAAKVTKKTATKGKAKAKAAQATNQRPEPTNQRPEPTKRAGERYDSIKRGATRSGLKFKK